MEYSQLDQAIRERAEVVIVFGPGRGLIGTLVGHRPGWDNVAVISEEHGKTVHPRTSVKLMSQVRL